MFAELRKKFISSLFSFLKFHLQSSKLDDSDARTKRLFRSRLNGTRGIAILVVLRCVLHFLVLGVLVPLYHHNFIQNRYQMDFYELFEESVKNFANFAFGHTNQITSTKLNAIWPLYKNCLLKYAKKNQSDIAGKCYFLGNMYNPFPLILSGCIMILACLNLLWYHLPRVLLVTFSFESKLFNTDFGEITHCKRETIYNQPRVSRFRILFLYDACEIEDFRFLIRCLMEID